MAAHDDIAHARHDRQAVGPRSAIRLVFYRYTIYHLRLAIRSFNCSDTQALFNRHRVKRFANIEAVARRKLVLLDAAATLDFLRVPPGNRLEALAGDRKGQHSIRINSQFRVCFAWTADGPRDVEIVDYH